MKIFPKACLMYVGLIFLTLFSLTGCGGGGGGPTGPENPPQLSNGRVFTEQPVHPGSIIALYIDYLDPSATMNDGTAYINGSIRTYHSTVSNAPGIEGTLLVSFELSPLVKPGELLLEVWIRNRAGSLSNTIYIPLEVEL
jgi:hypothetical protein